MVTLSAGDFNEIGVLAAHCDQQKLKIAVREASLFDMPEVFCEFWTDIEEHWTDVEGVFSDLINGTTYEGCGGKQQRHLGLKTALAYYAYSRYIILNGFNDSSTGMVNKTNQFSMPKPLRELKDFADKYRNMGRQVLKKAENYLCRNSLDFSNFRTNVCRPCGCAGECSGDSNTKGYGLRSKTITKWDVRG